MQHGSESVGSKQMLSIIEKANNTTHYACSKYLTGPHSRKHPQEEGTATHSHLLACRIPRTEEPGGLQSMGSQSQR